MGPSYTRLGRADIPGTHLTLAPTHMQHCLVQLRFSDLSGPYCSLEKHQLATTWQTCSWGQRAPWGSSPRQHCAYTAFQRPWCQLSALFPRSRLLWTAQCKFFRQEYRSLASVRRCIQATVDCTLPIWQYVYSASDQSAHYLLLNLIIMVLHHDLAAASLNVCLALAQHRSNNTIRRESEDPGGPVFTLGSPGKTF